MTEQLIEIVTNFKEDSFNAIQPCRLERISLLVSEDGHKLDFDATNTA